MAGVPKMRGRKAANEKNMCHDGVRAYEMLIRSVIYRNRIAKNLNAVLVGVFRTTRKGVSVQRFMPTVSTSD